MKKLPLFFAATLMQTQWASFSDDTRTTTTGSIFVRDTRFPALGDAWRDEDGLVWGDIVKNSAGKFIYVSHAEAEKYCEKIGARLPTPREFALLAAKMGAAGISQQQESNKHEAIFKKDSKGETVVDFYYNSQGYTVQVLPNLSADYFNFPFWTSALHPDYDNLAYSFSGFDGRLYETERSEDKSEHCAVRCVK